MRVLFLGSLGLVLGALGRQTIGARTHYFASCLLMSQHFNLTSEGNIVRLKDGSTNLSLVHWHYKKCASPQRPNNCVHRVFPPQGSMLYVERPSPTKLGSGGVLTQCGTLLPEVR